MLFSAEATAAEYAREGIPLRHGLRRPGFVPFDEIEAFSDGTASLRSGASRAVAPADRAPLIAALHPPHPSGDRSRDAEALVAYIGGPWSPVRAAGALLAMAAHSGASDVHIEAGEQRWGVRLRVVGELLDFLTLPEPSARRLVAALKHLASCLPYRSDRVQEGRIPRNGVAADVRASFLPTAFGERAALRLFGRLVTLDELGLDPATHQTFAAFLDRPAGLVLVAGPSGGGKTTTVYAALAHLALRRGGAHLSIEDPIEQRLRRAGIPVDQVELDPERGLTAEAALVGALRQDLDVIGLAEVRTPAEAALAVQAAHTGRLVIAGVHAGSAREGRQRLLDLGVEAPVLDATLHGVLFQRLVAHPCPAHEGDGCAACAGTGRVRRPAIELWEPQTRP